MEVVLALNVKAVEGSNMSNVLCTQSIPGAVFYDALLCFTPFYLYTITFVVLN